MFGIDPDHPAIPSAANRAHAADREAIVTRDQSITGERELISMIHSPSQLDEIDRVWPRE